ncbi:DUF3221 domain-containing protein [Paenibacillus sp. NPDC093718]|uniref:DUF3221 domain-containing protein n=1 Tax=Paenibacillus sp. NPDC093718 TaxID=3390601 RepID=UPI003D018D6F
MRKAISLSLFILGIVILISCSGNVRGEPNLIGRVVDKEGSRILVIGGITREEIVEQNVKDILDSDKYREVYWIRVKGFKSFDVGDQVRVWFSVVDDSYPAQTAAEKIENVKE